MTFNSNEIWSNDTNIMGQWNIMTKFHLFEFFYCIEKLRYLNCHLSQTETGHFFGLQSQNHMKYFKEHLREVLTQYQSTISALVLSVDPKYINSFLMRVSFMVCIILYAVREHDSFLLSKQTWKTKQRHLHTRYLIAAFRNI